MGTRPQFCPPCEVEGHSSCDGSATSPEGEEFVCLCSLLHSPALRVIPGGLSFDPDSEHARRGLAFQDFIRDRLSDVLGPAAGVRDVRGWLRDDLKISPESLNSSEKFHGDVTFVRGGRRYFVECCLALGGKSTRIGESKREKFVGPDRFYCVGISADDGLGLDRICFIPSMVLMKYLSKCPIGETDGYRFRTIGCHLIGPNIRAAAQSVEDFLDKLVR